MKAARTVMVIDNDDGLRMDITRWLTERGYSVVDCEDYSDALTRLHRIEQPALIAGELRILGLGPDTFRALQRGIPGFSAIPFLVMSSAENLSAWAVALGAAATLAKPFDKLAFLTVVDQLVERQLSP